MELNGRVALVTGGGGGLGAATVRHLVDVGMRVVIFDRAQEAADRVAADVGTATVAVAGDTTDDERQDPELLGGVHAGRTVDRTGAPHPMDAFTTTMDMNATGTFNVTRLACSAMATNEPDEDGQRGVVVNTASIAGLEGQTGQVAYAAAKAAILGMTLPMARDLAPLGIRVCAIAPGTMGTPLLMGAPESITAPLVENIVFPKRMGKPSEFGLLVESIARNPYLNGENIRLDGALRFPPK
jgi:NAD(P)-dependent dehydrogenase (short-subunit alcohol dehydrogenase family)